MASSRDGIQKRLMDERKALSDEGEPLFETDRAVQSQGRERSSLIHTIPSPAVKLMDLCDDDQVHIEIFENGYVVTKK